MRIFSLNFSESLFQKLLLSLHIVNPFLRLIIVFCQLKRNASVSNENYKNVIGSVSCSNIHYSSNTVEVIFSKSLVLTNFSTLLYLLVL